MKEGDVTRSNYLTRVATLSLFLEIWSFKVLTCPFQATFRLKENFSRRNSTFDVMTKKMSEFNQSLVLENLL